jgi:PRC-barrel domain protein
MSAPDIDTALSWRGRTVRDEDGGELGRLTELYLDGESRPAWAGVKRGLLGGTETIVPLEGAEEIDGDLRLPHHRRLFDDAPDVNPEVELTEEEEAVLRDHWGRGWAPPSGKETDTAMTRSEEEVEFDKRTVRKAERVRLKKVLVEDEVTQTVPVRREVIQLETESPPEGQIESVEHVEEDDPRT